MFAVPVLKKFCPDCLSERWLYLDIYGPVCGECLSELNFLNRQSWHYCSVCQQAFNHNPKQSLVEQNPTPCSEQCAEVARGFGPILLEKPYYGYYRSLRKDIVASIRRPDLARMLSLVHLMYEEVQEWFEDRFRKEFQYSEPLFSKDLSEQLLIATRNIQEHGRVHNVNAVIALTRRELTYGNSAR